MAASQSWGLNMKKTLLALVTLLLLAFPALSSGQAILVNTTLSASVADSTVRIFTLASATGVQAPNPQNPNAATFLFVDNEFVSVLAVNGTQISVIRGVNGTASRPHASGTVVFVLPAYLGTRTNAPAPFGACTRATEAVLPRISTTPNFAIISDCLGGQWVNGDGTTFPQPNGQRLPDPGGTALTTLETNGSAPAAATSIYCTEIDLPYSTFITGIGVLNGTTVGTDNHWVLLYDATGNLLGNSAAAGALSATASVYQKFALTAKYFAPGPAKFFACMGTSGTTATVRHAITSVNDNILAGAVTGQVFGTAAATITAPTTFTTATGPYMLLY
jgi:hypothetical protein